MEDAGRQVGGRRSRLLGVARYTRLHLAALLALGPGVAQAATQPAVRLASRAGVAPEIASGSGTAALGVLPEGAPDDDAPGIPWHRAQEAAAKSAALARRPLAPQVETQAGASLPIDATFYDLRLDLDPTTRTVRGDVAFEARVGSGPLASVLLDFDTTMHVDSVLVANQRADFSHTTDDLVVQLGRTHAPGEPFRIEVFYAGSPGLSSGLHFDTRNSQPLIWTLSEPFGARSWWPCQDTPADKADSAHVDLTVPDGLMAVSNGSLAETASAGGKTTYRWRERYPITPYLVSIAAHPYVALETSYTPQGGGTMPVTLWSFADQVGLAQPLVATTVQVLDRFAALFGEYPFVREKYAMAQFSWGGGMEHQTATSMCCWSTFLTVHETAHQWFGDAVTCQSFPHVWLNEGFATYAEALWDEGQGGASAYRANIWGNRFYGNGTIYVPPEQATSFGRIFDSNLSYNKASWVLHMLRWVLGDGPFFATLRAYLADPRFAYGTATTEDFQSVAEAVSGRDLADFFTRWIYTAYFPSYLYEFTPVQADDGWHASLSIEQLQSQGLYRMPIQVRVSTDAGTEDFVVQDDAPLQTFDLPVGAQPRAVTLDPEQWILCTTEAKLLAPDFYRGLLVVNGAPWSIGNELTSAYADSVFSAGLPFSFWDGYATPSGGYVPQLPPPLGHGALPPEVLQQFSTVVWVGDSDLDLWNNTSLVSYLRAGGNLLFLGRRGQEFLNPSRSSWLGLRWAESANATLAAATAVHPDFVPMSRTGTQSGCAVFETGFDQPETALLLTESQSFSTPRGIAAWRHPAAGGSIRPRGANLAFVSGRPYRWEHTALRTNVRTILLQLFGEPPLPTGALPPAAATRLLEPAPNPFNPGVTLRFELGRPGRVRLAVHDAAGRRVRTLLDAERPEGVGSIVWDGRDDRRREVPAGIYLLRLETGGQVRTAKLATVR